MLNKVNLANHQQNISESFEYLVSFIFYLKRIQIKYSQSKRLDF